MEINGNYFKNKAGNWQKITKGTKLPAWSLINFVPEEEAMKEAKKFRCAFCYKECIPFAFHPMKKKIKFCSVSHGKEYMKKDPDTRYTRNRTNYD